MVWTVKFFQTKRGDYPVLEFIKEQDVATKAKITHMIELLEDYGYKLKLPYTKKIDDELYELRMSGKSAVRIFYTFHSNKYYLLHAFKKKSQKLSARDIQTALDRKKKII